MSDARFWWWASAVVAGLALSAVQGLAGNTVVTVLSGVCCGCGVVGGFANLTLMQQAAKERDKRAVE